MMAVWVAQAMWWVAQAMWWEGCAGYVAVPGTFYIHAVVQLASLARFQAKLKFPSWTECGNNYLRGKNLLFTVFKSDLIWQR